MNYAQYLCFILIFFMVSAIGVADIFPVKTAFPVEIPINRTCLITSMVENNAGTPLDTLTIRFYLTGDDNSSIQNQTIDMLQYEKVAAYSVLTSTRTISLPSSLTTGEYTLWTESSALTGRQKIQNEVRAVGTVQVIPEVSPDEGVDLVAGGILFPDEVTAGDFVQLSGTVMNTGDTATNEPVMVHVRLVNETVPNSVTNISIWEIETMPAHGTGSSSSYEPVPDTVLPGYYYVEMVIDPDEKMKETKKSNNKWISFSPVHIILPLTTEKPLYSAPKISVSGSVIMADQ